MICEECIKAGEENGAGHFKRSSNHHEKCKGCECQHKTGHGWFVSKDSKAPLMQIQSP